MSHQHLANDVTSRRAAHRHGVPGRCHVGAWELVECVGVGQWSRVYACRPRDCPADWPADYAIKVATTDPLKQAQAAQLLAREAVIARAVSHPHLVAVLSEHLDAAPPFLLMPWLRGATLDAAIAARGPLAVPHALWLVRQVAAALAELHRGGWMHADVKPGNIHVSPAGHATLIDLGFGLRLESAECSAGSPLRGSLTYTAPEMISSAVPVDGRSDVYSLGITLYELLTGRPPFQDRDPGRLMLAHLQGSVPNPRRSLPNLDRDIWELLQNMLAKEPLRRLTADELVTRLIDLEILTFEHRVA